ncbi:DUF4142 domain-containing protein [Microvirga rosea]|uniref:DUF4142 domain-containing protein n=1 Tax=Microvirga rosea TaxID=2715425 RepID=UPI001D0BB8E1|nr:DUF4142 domain-containing protein [Microvirga rosea]MCB8821628.1 DUF4142 domain-containing protein [Microvirga rosea]
MKKYVVLAALLTTVSAPAFAQPMVQPMSGQTFRAMAAQSDAFEIASSRMALERSRNPRVRTFAQNMITDHGQTSAALNGGQPIYSANGEVLGSAVTGTLAGAGIGALVGGPVGAAVGAGIGATTGTVASSATATPGPKAGYDPNYDGPLGRRSGLRSGSLATNPDEAGPMTTGAVTAAPMNLPVQLDAEKTQMLNQLAAARGSQFDRLYGRYQRAAHQETLAMYQQYAQAGSDPALVNFAQSVIPHLEHHLSNASRLPGGR